ncbi:MAG: DNA-protecting protein DprA [Phycisphaerales bacterium]|nr:DNA-protecting protein DprA [Phycisphaerales bacterium]
MPRAADQVSDATLRLIAASGLGSATLRRLREHLGSDAAVVAASVADLRAVPGVGAATAPLIRRALDAVDLERERVAMTDAGAEVVQLGDDDYPPLLAAIPSPPATLWCRGSLDAADPLAVAIVGARRATAYGLDHAGRFGSLLAACGVVVVSGGARGVDAMAHRGALRGGGRTIAVLGCGLGHCYPPENADLFQAIVAGGGLVLSELPCGVPPRPGHFPRRNRLISGLSLGVLVVEAAARSGALITARLAAEDHGREVMAVPGRIDAPASAGCLQLIRDGGAALVRNVGDVLAQLDAVTVATRVALAAAGGADLRTTGSITDRTLTGEQRRILAVVTKAANPVPIPELAARLDRPAGELLADLTMLEVRGRVRRDGSGVRA